MTPKYKRILLKLSGEALMGEQQFGVDPAVATRIALDVGSIQALGVETAIVIGAKLDLAVIALPFVFAYKAIRGASPEAAPID